MATNLRLSAKPHGAMLALCLVLAAGAPARAFAAGGAADGAAGNAVRPGAHLPLDTVRELADQGRHYEALLRFNAADGQTDIADQLAAARSAWALGLVENARKIWDGVLANRDFDGVERARAAFARAILEHQEGNHEKARAVAETAAQKLEPSALRAQLWLVIGESLREQGALSLAEQYYRKAAEEGDTKTRSEAVYLLGECQYRLGLINESRYTFAELETTSSFTVQALRRLAEIDLMQRNYEGVVTWIEEGRESYSAEFSDGWTTYALVSAFTELGRLEAAEAELSNFRVKHNEGDPWFILALAGYEAAHAKRSADKEPAKPIQVSELEAGAQ